MGTLTQERPAAGERPRWRERPAPPPRRPVGARRLSALLLRVLTHLGALVPLARLLWDGLHNHLTANPIQNIEQRTGKDALILLVLSLACTPLNRYLGLRAVVPLRRTLGLYAFSYACLHFLVFVGLDYNFNPGLLERAIFEKPYALVGLSALLLLAPLALTSTKGWQRRLGMRWRLLHRLVYLAGPLVILHFVWSVKADYREAALYGTAMAVLLLLRVGPLRRRLLSLRQRAVPSRPLRAPVPAGR